MPPFGSTLAKIAALVGGVVLGTLLARWVDDLIASRAQSHPEADKTYYERGLEPLSPHRNNEENQKRHPDMPPRSE